MEYARSHVGRFFARFHERFDKIIAYFDLILLGNPTETRDGPLKTAVSHAWKTERVLESDRVQVGASPTLDWRHREDGEGATAP